MIDSAPNTTPITSKETPSPTWQRWFRSLVDLIRSDSAKITAMQAEINDLKARVTALE